MQNKIIPSVNVYIINDDKVLLSRRINTGWQDGNLCAPGGHVEKSETPKVAMLREIKEELGVVVKTEDLEFLCVATRNAQPVNHVAYEFAIRNKKYKFINAEPDKCAGLVWADIHTLPGDVISDFREIIIQSILGANFYLELGY